MQNNQGSATPGAFQDAAQAVVGIDTTQRMIELLQAGETIEVQSRATGARFIVVPKVGGDLLAEIRDASGGVIFQPKPRTWGDLHAWLTRYDFAPGFDAETSEPARYFIPCDVPRLADECSGDNWKHYASSLPEASTVSDWLGEDGNMYRATVRNLGYPQWEPGETPAEWAREVDVDTWRAWLASEGDPHELPEPAPADLQEVTTSNVAAYFGDDE